MGLSLSQTVGIILVILIFIPFTSLFAKLEPERLENNFNFPLAIKNKSPINL